MRTAKMFGDLVMRQSEVMAVVIVFTLLPVIVPAIVFEVHFNAVELASTMLFEHVSGTAKFRS